MEDAVMRNSQKVINRRGQIVRTNGIIDRIRAILIACTENLATGNTSSRKGTTEDGTPMVSTTL